MPSIKDLEKLKDLIHLDPATLKFVAPLILNSIIPKVVHVGGKYISTAGLVDKIVADGHIGLEDLPILVEAWFSGVDAPAVVQVPVQPVAPVQPTPVPGWPPVLPPSTWTPPPAAVPKPTAPAAGPASLALVNSLTIEFELHDTLQNNRAPISYHFDETAEAYGVVLDNYGTTNLPIHSGAYLHAGYLDASGAGINFEQRNTLDLYNTAVWIARYLDGSGTSTLAYDKSLGRYNQVDVGARVVNWNNEAEEPREATRTGGMDVPVSFPPEANDKVVEINLQVGSVTHIKPIRFPKIS